MTFSLFANTNLESIFSVALAIGIIFHKTKLGVWFWSKFGIFVKGTIVVAIIWLGYLAFSQTLFSSVGPLAARLTTLNSSHATIWIMYTIFLVYFAFRTNSLIKPIILLGVIIGFHELLWYVTYFAVHPDTIVHGLYFYSPFICMLGIFVFAGAILYRPDFRKMSYVLPFLIAYYVVWAVVGFPITLDLAVGITPYYYSNYVNALEVGSWLTIVLGDFLLFNHYGQFKPVKVMLQLRQTFNREVDKYAKTAFTRE